MNNLQPRKICRGHFNRFSFQKWLSLVWLRQDSGEYVAQTSGVCVCGGGNWTDAKKYVDVSSLVSSARFSLLSYTTAMLDMAAAEKLHQGLSGFFLSLGKIRTTLQMFVCLSESALICRSRWSMICHSSTEFCESCEKWLVCYLSYLPPGEQLSRKRLPPLFFLTLSVFRELQILSRE